MSRKKKQRNPKYYRYMMHFSPEAYELVAIWWDPGAKTKPHSHGNSHGLIRVMDGEIAQDVYDKKTKKHIASTIHGKGDVIFETPDIIHVMRNRGKSQALTIHYYTPPLSKSD